MKIKLEHPVIQKCSQECIDYVIGKSTSLGGFIGRIQKTAEKIALTPDNTTNRFYTPTEPNLTPSGTNTSNKFKGDIFELFTECFIKLSPIDDRIGVFDYHLVTEDDTGVDGWGYDRSGDKVTVQVKYRMWDYQLDSIKEHLDNFRYTSYKKFGIDPKAVGKMLIITTGKQIHWETLERDFSGKVRCISNNASYGCLKGAGNKTIDSLFSLKTIVDNNKHFWDIFRESVNKSKG